MPIPIEKEPDEIGPPYEACCFCERPTPYWTALKRRKPGAQVACCPKCAPVRAQKDVPTKEEWFDKQG